MTTEQRIEQIVRTLHQNRFTHLRVQGMSVIEANALKEKEIAEAQQALLALVGEERKNAFLGGFRSSGEGFNGEICGDRGTTNEEIWSVINPDAKKVSN
jgi:hypothetical protein